MIRTLAGRYRLIAQLGVGGMGVTYRAWDGQRAVPVVVKMPRPEQTDADSLRRFAREIETMVSLRHDHIVPVLDHGEDGGLPFVVMRFLPGGSLSDQRRHNPDGSLMPTPPGFLRFWLPSIADAIDFVHRHGVVHRDVKPRNIFFDSFWNAFLGDFGIAKVLDESGGLAREQTLTAATFAMGTQEYMAPELFRKMQGAKETGQIDQYALGVTVYEMLAGFRPFTGSKAHIAVEHLQMKPPSLHKRGLGLPDGLCAALERALEKRPEDRFPTCAAFAAAAIADVPMLDVEPGVARLLCPKCGMILRVPVTSGGRSGACPTCRSVMRIAADLGALWLPTEDTGDATTADEPAATFAFEDDLAAASASRPPAGLGPRWREAWDRVVPERLRDAGVARPAIAALVAFAVAHGMWSVHHRRVVDDLHRGRDTDVAAVETRLARADAERTGLRQERDALHEELSDMQRVVAKSSFQDLATLSTDTARTLVRHKRGEPLRLDGVTSLPAETAEVLATHVGVLSLDGLARLSDGAAAALARHKGPLLLRGLLTASPEAVRTLRANGEIQLPPQLRPTGSE